MSGKPICVSAMTFRTLKRSKKGFNKEPAILSLMNKARDKGWGAQRTDSGVKVKIVEKVRRHPLCAMLHNSSATPRLMQETAFIVSAMGNKKPIKGAIFRRNDRGRSRSIRGKGAE
jgi:hypothetical protein